MPCSSAKTIAIHHYHRHVVQLHRISHISSYRVFALLYEQQAQLAKPVNRYRKLHLLRMVGHTISAAYSIHHTLQLRQRYSHAANTTTSQGDMHSQCGAQPMHSRCV